MGDVGHHFGCVLPGCVSGVDKGFCVYFVDIADHFMGLQSCVYGGDNDSAFDATVDKK